MTSVASSNVGGNPRPGPEASGGSGPVQGDERHPAPLRAFPAQFAEAFDAHFERLFRYLNRLSGDRDLAGDLAQEAFIRLFRCGAMPDFPTAWLVSCAMNLFRNSRSTAGRRRRLLTLARGEHAHSDPSPSAEDASTRDATRRRVRSAIDRLPERDRHLLLLRAEGFSYREIASALELNEASVGTLLARAREAFRESYGGSGDEP